MSRNCLFVIKNIYYYDYDSNNWYKTDINKWYSYEESIWANTITVNSNVNNIINIIIKPTLY